MINCPFCANKLSEEATACGGCGARKAYDYRNGSRTTIIVLGVVFMVAWLGFMYMGYTDADPKVASGAKILAIFYGSLGGRLLSRAATGPGWWLGWRMRRAQRSAATAS